LTFLGTGPELAAERLPLAVRQGGENVPAVVWLPASSAPPTAIVLVGHGGGMDKDAPFITRLARHLAGSLGFAAVAIDAPHHGERTPAEEKGLSPLERRGRMGLAAWRERNSQATAQAVADWRAAIDAVQGLAAVPDVPVGYFGVSMGTRFGIPLAAAEPRIKAAVLGLFGHPADDGDAAFARAARQVTIPVLFLLQWNDELFPRNDGLALFDLLGSRRKTMHANPGGHRQIPPGEFSQAVQFLRQHLGANTPLASGAPIRLYARCVPLCRLAAAGQTPVRCAGPA
jgi:dienelactone hydrolase